MNNKQDLRVIKTKRNLYGSLLLNMKDKPFEEIKVRSYEDVINNDLKKNLLNKLKPFYDLNKINIEFNIKWKLDVDVDYIF